MMRILVAGATVRAVTELAGMLSHYDDVYKVERAVGTLEVKRALNGGAADLILINACSRAAFGIDILSDLYRLGVCSEAPVVILSDYMTDDFIENAVSLGAKLCIAVPISEAQLHERLIMALKADAVTTYASGEKSPNMSKRIGILLSEYGIMPNCVGFHYLGSALRISIGHGGREKLLLTKDVYPEIAARCKTSKTCVERAMRACISSAWEYREVRRSRMTQFRSKPCNGHFIAVLAQSLERDEYETGANAREV